MNRRGFLAGMLAACAAPAVVKAASLMPVRGLIVPPFPKFHPMSIQMMAVDDGFIRVESTTGLIAMGDVITVGNDHTQWVVNAISRGNLGLYRVSAGV